MSKDVRRALETLVASFNEGGLNFIQNYRDTRKFTIAYNGTQLGEYVVSKNLLSFGLNSSSANQSLRCLLANKNLLSIDGTSIQLDRSNKFLSYAIPGNLTLQGSKSLVEALKIIYQLNN